MNSDRKLNNMEKISGEKLYILGASLFAEDIADLMINSRAYELLGFIEGIDQKRCSQKIFERPIFWINDISGLDDNCKVICAVGSPKRRHFILQALSQGLQFTTFAHPSTQVSATANIGMGSIVSAGSIIATTTSIG